MDDQEWPAARKLTHEQARAEQRLYWMEMTVAERLIASRALTDRLLRMRGLKPNERLTDLTARRVARRSC